MISFDGLPSPSFTSPISLEEWVIHALFSSPFEFLCSNNHPPQVRKFASSNINLVLTSSRSLVKIGLSLIIILDPEPVQLLSHLFISLFSFSLACTKHSISLSLSLSLPLSLSLSLLPVLLQHQRAKHYKCPQCPRRLNTAGGLTVHLNQVHKTEPDRWATYTWPPSPSHPAIYSCSDPLILPLPSCIPPSGSRTPSQEETRSTQKSMEWLESQLQI